MAGDAGALVAVVVGAAAGAWAAAEADVPLPLPVDAEVVAGGVLSTVKGAAPSASVVWGAAAVGFAASAGELVAAGAAALPVEAGSALDAAPGDVEAPGIRVSVMPEPPEVVLADDEVAGAWVAVEVVAGAAVAGSVVADGEEAAAVVVPLAVAVPLNAAAWSVEVPPLVDPIG